MQITLKPLTAHDGSEIYTLLREMPEDENGFMNPMHGKSDEEIQASLLANEASGRKTEIEDGWRVPQTIYWLYADNTPVGMGKLRHMLTPALRADGGNIGYAIVKSARGKGLGKQLLACLLREAARKGLASALVTINTDNLPSLKTALACGGAIEKTENGKYYVWLPCGES